MKRTKEQTSFFATQFVTLVSAELLLVLNDLTSSGKIVVMGIAITSILSMVFNVVAHTVDNDWLDMAYYAARLFQMVFAIVFFVFTLLSVFTLSEAFIRTSGTSVITSFFAVILIVLSFWLIVKPFLQLRGIEFFD